MSAAIITKWRLDVNGNSKVTASTGWGDMKRTHRYAWNGALGDQQNHVEAARVLAARLGWSGTWVGGDTETGWVFVRLMYSAAASDVAFVIPPSINNP